MNNKTQQTAVDWFSNKAYELFEQYSEGKFDRITLNKLMLKATKKAKEMEKEQVIKDFVGYDSDTEDNLEVAEQYYNETYGGNK